MGFRCSFVVMLLAVLAFASRASAVTIQVPGMAPTIQSAINSAQPGDIVVVAPGTYMGTINFLGRAITVRSAAGPENTTLDGGGLGSVVTFASGETQSSVLEGFTITNGSGTLCNVPENTNCGGAIYCVGSSPLLRDLIMVDNNVSDDGGAIYAEGSSLVVEDSFFIDNLAVGVCSDGGAISVSLTSNILVSRCVFIGNRTSFCGGAIEVIGLVTVRNTVFLRNESGNGSGGGIGCRSVGTATVENCTFARNLGCFGGGAVGQEGGNPNPGSIRNSILWENEADCLMQLEQVSNGFSVNFSNVQGGATGFGNIDVDPLFVSLNQDDARLRANSPCIDQGDNFVVSAGDTDFEGQPRIRNGTVDLGADEAGVDNDDCAGALPIIDSVPTPFATAVATASGFTTLCRGMGAQRDVWFEYVVPCNGSVELSTCDFPFVEAAIGVWVGGCPAPGQLADFCSDQGINCGLFGARVVIPGVSAGEVLSIHVTAGETASDATAELLVVCSGSTPEFRRGDCNRDATFDLADAVSLLSFLFPSGSPPSLFCEDACDTTDDGLLNIADAVSALSSLFPSGPPMPLPNPFNACGPDPTPDGLSCNDYPCP